MKTTRMLALINVLAALTGSAVLAQPAPEDRPGQQGPPQESLRPNRPNPEARRQALLEKYDANKDGKLDDSELTSIGRDVEQGKLEPRLLGVGPRGGGMGPGPRFRGGRGPVAPRPLEGGGQGFGPGPQARGPGFGPGPREGRGPGFGQGDQVRGPGFGPGPMGPRQSGGPGFGPRREKLLQMYDANMDGQLDESERAAIRQDVEDGRLQPRPFAPGRRGFGPPPEQGAPGMPPPGEGPQE